MFLTVKTFSYQEKHIPLSMMPHVAMRFHRSCYFFAVLMVGWLQSSPSCRSACYKICPIVTCLVTTTSIVLLYLCTFFVPCQLGRWVKCPALVIRVACTHVNNSIGRKFYFTWLFPNLRERASQHIYLKRLIKVLEKKNLKFSWMELCYFHGFTKLAKSYFSEYPKVARLCSISCCQQTRRRLIRCASSRCQVIKV